jgi:hypothetical protein
MSVIDPCLLVITQVVNTGAATKLRPSGFVAAGMVDETQADWLISRRAVPPVKT